MKQRPIVAQLALLAVCGTVVGSLRVAITHRPPPPRLPALAVGLPSAYVRLGGLGFASLAADLLWIRFVQDVPTTPADEATGHALATELRATTTLDPTFRAPYVHGTVLLSVLGNQPCESLGVLEEGIPRFPDDWRLSFQAGYECFSELGDMECAERHMKRAASMEGSPKWLPGLVARFLATNQRTQAGIEYLQTALSHTTDPRLRAQFEERLREAMLTASLERIDLAIRGYRTSHQGAPPSSLQDLVAGGLLPALPAKDPVGGHFEIGPDGHARSSTGQGKLRPARVQAGLSGDLGERFLPERVDARRDGILGHPSWTFFESDRVATAGRVLSMAIQGLTATLRDAEDPTDLQNLRVLSARTIMAWDVDRLRRAQIEMLRAGSATPLTIEELATAADVPDHDPFGSRYTLDPNGIPSPAKDRHPMVNVQGRGAAACR